MKYQEALTHIKRLLLVRPSYIVGGSVALILQGVIPEREVGDFDLVLNFEELDLTDTSKINDIVSRGQLDFNYGATSERDYACVKISRDERASEALGMAFYYNIFIRNHTQVRTVYVGDIPIKVQASEEILYYKKLWLREKDRRDLEDLL